MIKNRLKREEECDTYLTWVCRYLCSIERSGWKHRDQELYTFTADESHGVGWKILVSLLSDWSFYAMWKFTDMNKVGVLLPFLAIASVTCHSPEQKLQFQFLWRCFPQSEKKDLRKSKISLRPTILEMLLYILQGEFPSCGTIWLPVWSVIEFL